MSNQYEQGNTSSDSWELGEDLITEAINLERQLSLKEYQSDVTQNLLQEKLITLSDKYAGTPVMIKTPLAIVPHEGGVAAGSAEVSGTIVGVGWGEYPTISVSFDEGTPHNGLLLYLVTSGVNNVDGKDAANWRHNVVPELELPDEYQDQFIISIPVQAGIQICSLEKGQEIPDTVDRFIEIAEQDSPVYDYMSFVKRIDSITERRAFFKPNVDKPWVIAMEDELEKMCLSCPYLGKKVSIDSDNLRVPDPRNPRAYIKLQGTADGYLRKFKYSPYVDDNGETKGGVMAVVYTPEIHLQVSLGRLSPQDADRSLGAVFIPLSLPHKLTIVS